MNELTIRENTVWTEDAAVDRLTILPGAALTAPAGKSLVLEVNGELRDPAPGVYEGDVRIRVLAAMETWGDLKGPYRSGLYFGPAGLDPAHSALGDRHPAGAVSLKKLDLTLRGNFLNGISCGGGKVTVEDSTLRLYGNGDDFRLTGTAVAAAGDGDLTLRNCTLLSEGVAATTVAAGGESDVLLEGCTLRGRGIRDDDFYLTDHHLTVVPWVLGLRGNVRASNLLENGTLTFYDTDAACNGWGVLSVDAVKQATHNVINCRAAIPADSDYASGYCAYLLGGTTSTFLGCELEAPDYVFAVGGNDHHTLVGPSSRDNLRARAEQLRHLDREVGLENIPERPAIVRGGRFAGMWHHASTGEFEILPGTEVSAGVCAFLIKSGDRLNPPVIRCDGVTIQAPMLLHLMESDDPGMGTYGRDGSWAPYYQRLFETSPAEGHDLTAVTEESVRAEFRNMTLTGDCYNTKQGKPQNLSLNLDHTSLTGVISSGTHIHRDWTWGLSRDESGRQFLTDKAGRAYETETVEGLLFGKMPVTYLFPVRDGAGAPVYAADAPKLTPVGYQIAMDQPELLADVAVTVSAPVNNGVILELKNGSTWSVTGESWLSALTVDDGCSIRGRMFVDGAETPAAPGAYRGRIQVLPL